MLIQPATHVVTMEAGTCDDGDMALGSNLDAVHWDSVVAEYSDV